MLDSRFYTWPGGDTYFIYPGARTSMPHGVPSDAAVQAGDFVLMDFGAMVNGYHSDMTRTVCVGTPTEKMKSVYEVVQKAQAAALQAARAGITGKALDALPAAPEMLPPHSLSALPYCTPFT